MTNFNWLLDGSIVGVYLLVTMIAGLMVRKYVGKVEHFLVAGREMDVYLGIASLAATEFVDEEHIDVTENRIDFAVPPVAGIRIGIERGG